MKKLPTILPYHYSIFNYNLNEYITYQLARKFYDGVSIYNRIDNLLTRLHMNYYVTQNNESRLHNKLPTYVNYLPESA